MCDHLVLAANVALIFSALATLLFFICGYQVYEMVLEAHLRVNLKANVAPAFETSHESIPVPKMNHHGYLVFFERSLVFVCPLSFAAVASRE
jgi:hypothetical protein